MDFVSFEFLFYFLPIFLLAYYNFPPHFRKKVAIIGSVIFYSWLGTWFVFPLVISLLVDFNIIEKISSSENTSRRKKLLIASIILNLAPLLFFKLAIQAFEKPETWLLYSLPIGLTIITLQRIHYSYQVFQKSENHFQEIEDYLFYQLFFPKIFAGNFANLNLFKQERSTLVTMDTLYLGAFRFAIGLTKKVLIANTLGAFTQLAFSKTETLLTSQLLLASIALAIQLLVEFNAYSDMARGLAIALGYDLKDNSNQALKGTGFKGFLEKFHQGFFNWVGILNISHNPLINKLIISTFVFIILGISIPNLVIVILFNALLMIEEKALGNVLKRSVWVSIFYNLIIFSFAITLYRISDLEILNKISTAENVESIELNTKTYLAILFGFLISIWSIVPKLKDFTPHSLPEKWSVIGNAAIAILFLVSIVYLCTNPIQFFTHIRF
jgi:alginate O-acetyltransferase complex protein AlgI